eukprot:m.113508 g.113508  ORF g.113508 m.113508 type:complete len:57 (+) comp13517_c0_seq1:205-375(+)
MSHSFAGVGTHVVAFISPCLAADDASRPSTASNKPLMYPTANKRPIIVYPLAFPLK